jgi:hypothetical protein
LIKTIKKRNQLFSTSAVDNLNNKRKLLNKSIDISNYKNKENKNLFF